MKPRPKTLLGQLEDLEPFSYDVACRYCGCCAADYEHNYIEAAFERAIPTEFGPVHIYIAQERDKCDNCSLKRCDCDRSVAFAVRAIPSSLVLSVDFRYAPGQSLTAIATTISGREVDRLVVDLQKPPIEDLDSTELHAAAAAFCSPCARKLSSLLASGC